MLLILALVLNLAPVQDAKLDTAAGKQVFSQKVKSCSDELADRWGHVQELQNSLNAELKVLGDIPKETKEWKTTSEKCNQIAENWKKSTENLPELQALVQAGIRAMNEPQFVVKLLDIHRKGEALSQEDQEFLQKVSMICERASPSKH